MSQVLYSYQINSQTALSVGYSDRYLGDPGRGLVQTDRAVFVKIGYAWVRKVLSHEPRPIGILAR